MTSMIPPVAAVSLCYASIIRLSIHCRGEIGGRRCYQSCYYFGMPACLQTAERLRCPWPSSGRIDLYRQRFEAACTEHEASRVNTHDVALRVQVWAGRTWAWRRCGSRGLGRCWPGYGRRRAHPIIGRRGRICRIRHGAGARAGTRARATARARGLAWEVRSTGRSPHATRATHQHDANDGKGDPARNEPGSSAHDTDSFQSEQCRRIYCVRRMPVTHHEDSGLGSGECRGCSTLLPRGLDARGACSKDGEARERALPATRRELAPQGCRKGRHRPARQARDAPGVLARYLWR